MIFAAGYLLWMFQRMFFGDLSEFFKSHRSRTSRTCGRVEALTLVPLGVLTVVFGLFPGLLLDPRPGHRRQTSWPAPPGRAPSTWRSGSRGRPVTWADFSTIAPIVAADPRRGRSDPDRRHHPAGRDESSAGRVGGRCDRRCVIVAGRRRLAGPAQTTADAFGGAYLQDA